MLSVKNGISYELNGWKYISIKGTPRERALDRAYADGAALLRRAAASACDTEQRHNRPHATSWPRVDGADCGPAALSASRFGASLAPLTSYCEPNHPRTAVITVGFALCPIYSYFLHVQLRPSATVTEL